MDSVPQSWDGLRLFVFLNHTSLFEPIFFGAIPASALIKGAKGAIIPGADKTLDRPLVGQFFKLLSPNMVSVTRKRDDSWDEFLDRIQSFPKDRIIALAPEGRMKRPTGLDSDGRPMSIRGGIADILSKLTSEEVVVIAYSGGLHHVQAPGQKFPRLFQPVEVRFERLTVGELLRGIPPATHPDFKDAVIEELSRRMKLNTPAPRAT